MHIPDGFLAPPVFISCWAFALVQLSYALKRTARVLKDKTIPLMGVMSAFIFSAQMLNFPVLGGTSGHLMGGILAAVTLGPNAGFIVISLVLVVQCLIFQDGGISALGANILNMAGIGTFLSYYLLLLLKKIIPKNKGLCAVFIGSWFSVLMSATFCSFELALSRIIPLSVVLPTMLFVHVLIGLGEAIITTFILGFIIRVRPDLVYGGQ